MSALPGDPTFNQFNNHYDVPSYKRLCAEFGIDPSSDFRFTHGKNGGLGHVYVFVQGATKTEYAYPGWNKFSDEGGKAINGNLVYYIEPDKIAATQYHWFAPKTAAGLTNQPVNRGICILHLGRTSEREEQHTRGRRESERGSDRVSDSDGRRHKTAGLVGKRAKIPASS